MAPGCSSPECRSARRAGTPIFAGGTRRRSNARAAPSLQFRVDEIEAAVEQASNWRSYVMVHAYSADAIRRAVDAGT
jgi:imidazolonepropionase-like amidohydrolase